MAIDNDNQPLSEFDPEIYGGGSLVPVRGGAADGTMFFVAPNTVLASEYDAIMSQPFVMGEEAEAKVHLFMTVKGKINNQDKLGAATFVMSLEMAMELIKDIRKLVSEVPMHLRSVD
jgi:hypothetical protein